MVLNCTYCYLLVLFVFQYTFPFPVYCRFWYIGFLDSVFLVISFIVPFALYRVLVALFLIFIVFWYQSINWCIIFQFWACSVGFMMFEHSYFTCFCIIDTFIYYLNV